MLVSDWSSDVCSSDLTETVLSPGALSLTGRSMNPSASPTSTSGGAETSGEDTAEIGRASCRERVEISAVAVSVEKNKVEEEVDGGAEPHRTVEGAAVY